MSSAIHEAAQRLHQHLESTLAVSGCLLALAAEDERGEASAQTLARMYSLAGAVETLLILGETDAHELKLEIDITRQPRLAAGSWPPLEAD